VYISCYETHNDDPSDISECQPNMEDDEIDYFERHTIGIGSKLMNEMGFDGKRFRKKWARHLETHRAMYKAKK